MGGDEHAQPRGVHELELAQVDDDVLPVIEPPLDRRFEVRRGRKIELATDDDDRASVAVGDRDRESGRVERHAARDTLVGWRVVALEPCERVLQRVELLAGLRDVRLELAGGGEQASRGAGLVDGRLARCLGIGEAAGAAGVSGGSGAGGATGAGRTASIRATGPAGCTIAAASTATTGAATGAGRTASIRATGPAGCTIAAASTAMTGVAAASGSGGATGSGGAGGATRLRRRGEAAAGAGTGSVASDAAWAAAAAACAAAAAASAARSTASARWAGVCESGLTGAMLAWPHVALLDLDAGGHLRLRARGHRHRHREACLDCGAMFASIVVGTDGSQTAREAVRQSVELARRHGARLDIVSAYEPVPAGRLREEAQQVPGDLQWMVNAREDVDATLREAAAESEAAGIPTETYARQGDPADAILDVAEERGADLIVVGNKGMTGAKRFLLGSVPNKISHHAPCSVLIIRTT